MIAVGPETGPGRAADDPTCGSGSLLVKAADEAPNGLTIYGQGMDVATRTMARMNLILHGRATAEIRQGNTLAALQLTDVPERLTRFDFAVANPSFSTKAWSIGTSVSSAGVSCAGGPTRTLGTQPPVESTARWSCGTGHMDGTYLNTSRRALIKRNAAARCLSRFLHERYGRTWDDAPLPRIGLKDLDDRAVNRFLSRAVAGGRPRPVVHREPVESLIANLRLRDESYLKRAAALLFHLSPEWLMPDACVKIAYFRASELLFQDVIGGNLFTQVDRTMDLLDTEYMLGLISYNQVYCFETFSVPSDAMREAVINAIIHCEYANATPIQIRVYNDRLSISNAAHVSPEWAAERLAEKLSSQPYNPRIAYAFFLAGLIEAMERGVRRIVDLCREAGNPTPAWRFEAGGNGLQVRFPYSAPSLAARSAALGNAAGHHSGA
ncbi:MAG: N-6 DNA methylase [Bryobacterales bacterium]|nr:N-6 DNA methylase [Bryobacterales bacterium]